MEFEQQLLINLEKKFARFLLCFENSLNFQFDCSLIKNSERSAKVTKIAYSIAFAHLKMGRKLKLQHKQVLTRKCLCCIAVFAVHSASTRTCTNLFESLHQLSARLSYLFVFLLHVFVDVPAYSLCFHLSIVGIAKFALDFSAR